MNQLCQCGCGQITPLARKTNNAKGRVKGHPLSYIYGHNSRKSIYLKHCLQCGKVIKRKRFNCGREEDRKIYLRRKFCDYWCAAKYRKGKLNPHKGNVFGDDIVEHHNDLCHGALRPDDITSMPLSDHARLHGKLRMEDGTHPFISRE